MKLRPKFFGPYKVTKKMKHGRYEVQRVANRKGPNLTTTSAILQFYSPLNKLHFFMNSAAGVHKEMEFIQFIVKF